MNLKKYFLFFLLFLIFSCDTEKKYYRLGKKDFDQNKKLSSLVWFTKVLEENKNHAEANFYSAKLLEESEFTQESALKHYLFALKNFSDHTENQGLKKEALHRALKISFSLEKFKRVQELSDEYRQKEKNDSFLYIMSSKASLKLKDKKVARKYAQSGYVKFSNSSELAILLGDIINQHYKEYYLGLEIYQEAEQRNLKSKEVSPEQIILRLAYGNNLIRNYKQASIYLAELLEKKSISKKQQEKYLEYQKLFKQRRWKKL